MSYRGVCELLLLQAYLHCYICMEAKDADLLFGSGVEVGNLVVGHVSMINHGHQAHRF